MGRKPNQLVMEFFTRGRKLKDASNRYEQTCNSCGNTFPRGRIEYLISHLLKKCLFITPNDRQRVIVQLTETPNQNGSLHPVAVAMRQEQTAHINNELMSQFADLSALETLAEVSRQRLDAGGEAEKSIPLELNPRKRKRTEVDDIDQSGSGEGLFLLQLQMEQEGLNQEEVEQEHLMHHNVRDNINLFTVEPHHVLDGPIVAQAQTNSFTDTIGDHAAITATNPTTSLENTSTAVVASTYPGPPFDSQLRLPEREQQGHYDFQAWYPSNACQQASESATPMSNSYGSHFSFVECGTRMNKTRRKYSADRRSEVKALRKQGACIRCRMLKKPCSGGTPCNTCANIESARLWKQPCLRTRIAYAFDLYAASLNTMLFFHEYAAIRKRIAWNGKYHIEATHLPVNNDFQPAVLPSKRGHINRNAAESKEDNANASVNIELIEEDSLDVKLKLEAFIKASASAAFRGEPSAFMRSTLLLAADLASQKQDPALNTALELWTTTNILTEPDVTWTILSLLDEFGPDGHFLCLPLDAEADEFSRRLIALQLRGYVEKTAANLARDLLNDIEKRVLQRQQASSRHFETFLSAIIFLNCAERMTWVFSRWLHPEDGHCGAWPLNKSAEEYVAKGERIAEILSMLLRIRGVPPRVRVDADGYVRLKSKAHSVVEPTLDEVLESGLVEALASGHESVSAITQEWQAAKDEEQIASWLDAAELRENSLEQARAGQQGWNANDSRCFELRLISHLFLNGELQATTETEDAEYDIST